MFLLPENYWEVKQTNKRGKGVYAIREIKPGKVIGDYLGTVLRTAEADTHERDGLLYLMYYHDYASIFPDLNKPGVHLLNHSCTPNLWMYTLEGHTLFFALRHIFPGEELTISYLLSPKDAYCDPCTHQCVCASAFCTGTMHLSEKDYADWNKFHDAQMRATKKRRIAYNKPLTPLPTYPRTIPDNSLYRLYGSNQQPPESLQTKTVPSTKIARGIIRQTGKRLFIPQLQLHIYGVVDDALISTVSSHV